MTYRSKFVHRLLVASLGLSLSCMFGDDSADGGIVEPMPEPMPDWNECATEGDGDACSGSSGSGSADDAPCSSSEECAGDRCVAPYDPATEELGPFACQFTCVPDLDDTQWCSDDAACCNESATCTARGYCVLEDPTGGSSSSGDTDTDGSASGGDTDTDTDTDTTEGE
jgi:hypothetical protein